MKHLSQKERVRRHLDRGWKLTRLNAWDKLGVLECPSRINELRAEGYPIITKMVSVKNRFGESVRVAEWKKEKA